MRFAAFISYSHADVRWAKRLHRMLESFRFPAIPPDTAFGRSGQRFGRVFRDDDELRASGDLSATIGAALEDARALIVICSPQAAVSAWVSKEIREFRALGKGDYIVPVLAPAADRATSIPQALLEGDDGSQIEPLIVTFPRSQFHDSFLRILATASDVQFDDLKQRQKRRELLQRLQIAGGTIAVAGLLSIAAAYAHRTYLQQVGTALVEQSITAYDRNEYDLSLRYALAAMPDRASFLTPEPASAEFMVRKAALASSLVRYITLDRLVQSGMVVPASALPVDTSSREPDPLAQMREYYDVDTAPNSSNVLLYTPAGRIALLNAETGDFRVLSDNPQQPLQSAAISDDGEIIAVATEAGVLRVMGAGGEAWGEVSIPDLAAHDVSFSPGREVIIVQYAPPSAIGPEIATIEAGQSIGEVIANLPPRPSGQTHLYAVRRADRSIVRIGAVPEGRIRFTPDGSHYWLQIDNDLLLSPTGVPEFVHSLSFTGAPITAWEVHPLGPYMALGMADGSVYLVSTETAAVLRRYPNHSAYVRGLRFNNSGDRLLSYGEDRIARILDTETAAIIKDISEHQTFLRNVEVSPDGGAFMTSGEDGNSFVWQAQTGRRLQVLRASRQHGASSHFIADGRLILSEMPAEDGIRIWSARPPTAAIDLYVGGNNYTSADVSADGNILAMAAEDGGLHITTRDNGATLHTSHRRDSAIAAVRLSVDERALLVCYADGEYLIQNLSGDILQRNRLAGRLVACEWSPGGTSFAAATMGGTVTIHALGAESNDRHLTDGAGEIAALQTYDNAVCAVVARGAPRCWSWTDGSPAPTGPLTSHDQVSFAPIITGDVAISNNWLFGPGAIDVTSTRHNPMPRNSNQPPITRNVVSAGMRNEGPLLVRFLDHSGAVNSARLSRGQRFLATAGVDGTVRVFDVLGALRRDARFRATICEARLAGLPGFRPEEIAADTNLQRPLVRRTVCPTGARG